MKPSRKLLPAVFIGAAVLLFAISLFTPKAKGDTRREARRVEAALSQRLQGLDAFAERAFEGSPDQWMNLGKLPADMVVYRYVSDRLQSWANQFPVANDDIVRRSYSIRYRRRGIAQTPFLDLNSYYTYLKLNQQESYLVKRVDRGLVSVVVGLKLDGNDKLRLDEGYSIRNLHTPDGTSVSYAGQPVFKVVYESLPVRSKLPTQLVWIAFLLFALGIIVRLKSAPTLRGSLVSIGLLLLSTVALAKWYPLTEGELSQISVILVINIITFMVALCLFLCRESLWAGIKTRAGRVVAVVADALFMLGIFAFSYIELFKVFVYTHISLDLTKLDMLSWESAAVLGTFVLMLSAIILLAVLLTPVLSRRREVNLLSVPCRVIASLVLALYLVLATTSMGFEREQVIASSWAENLANDRDNAVEEQLKKAENQIAADEVLSRASGSEENTQFARERIIDNYLFRVLSDYDVRVQIGGDSDGLGLESGTRIAQNSRFFYAPLSGQRSRYVGAFQYYVEDQGQNTIYVSIEPKSGDGGRSLSSVLGLDNKSDEIPWRYSYAKYKGRDRQYLKGSYAYPTRLTEEKLAGFRSLKETEYVSGGYLHFVNQVSEDEIIIISRQYKTVDSNLLALALVTLIFFLFASIFAGKSEGRAALAPNSFKKTITILTTVSLTATMAVLVTFSVTFVFGRNEANARTMMADKTNSIRTMLQAGLRSYSSSDALFSRETLALIRRVSDNSGSDISIFRPDGRILMSTSPELFEKMVLGSRLNENAYYHIMYLSEGYYIQREKYGTRWIYTMYAPVMGSDGNIVAIFASPYMERNYDFQLDAATHTISIVIVFVILLLLSLALISYAVDRTFRPISEMSRKMEAGGVDRLEYISYDRQDEISSLVQSYNRMVTDLTASTKALAQAERDKAWSEMARNVAHEIKNPLTPMRLQIQRIQRLKANGDPSWQTKFDDMATILLDHIDVLTETANQFSDFAKLYSEEPVEIRLDELLRDEVDMYDTRPGVEFEYLGLPDVVIRGPRPQLVRVFVNLLNNAVQACEGISGAKVLVSLRNGSDPGFYEIVFEDNGPGVPEENMPKLFTPKFTTKSSGSGLGLSICKSILERCGAAIAYSRSFKLGGACFTIRYPKE
ncbi:MAG: HAMP domain-containing histidine kinase [Bacteroidales bacterium]|nr:HAMP domain-containing histidine kinase [Bacteroidales bacterium]